ncbi:leucyl/phenylalanyl-tRNA--protein transferase [candidate division KSB1 bacterium]|nr:leucyl/phenylalanyl-tRNA--protein transferase [candidate division KSB1 bacterium]
MIPPETLLEAYRQGIFPMADEDGTINWYEANPRAIVEIDGYRIPHDLKRILNRGGFEIFYDRSFEQVMRGCMNRTPTWISEELVRSYVALHRMGHAHSVEAWQNGELVGGLYGVAIGGAFFGESMFSRVSHASKVALVHLLQHLQAKKFALHDAQVMTSTLKLFGAKNISSSEYLLRLRAALKKNVSF